MYVCVLRQGGGVTVGNWSIWSDSPRFSVNLSSRSSFVGQSVALSTSASLQHLSDFGHHACVCVCVCVCVYVCVCVCRTLQAPASVSLHVALLHPTHSINKLSLRHANTKPWNSYATKSTCVCVCVFVCVCVCFRMCVFFWALCLSHSPVSEPLSLKIQMTQ